MANSGYQEHWSILKWNMNLRLKKKNSKAQIHPSKKANKLETLQKTGLAEEAYSAVNPVMLQWLISIKLGNLSLPLCTSNVFSPCTRRCWSAHFSSFYCHYSVSLSPQVGATSISKTESGVTLKWTAAKWILLHHSKHSRSKDFQIKNDFILYVFS